MKRSARLVAALALTGSLVSVTDASGADRMLVEDGGELAIDLAPLAPCVVEPRYLRRPDACKGIDVDAAKIPAASGGQRIISVAYVRLADGRIAVLSIQKSADASDPGVTSREDAVESFEGMRGAIPGNIPGASAKVSGVRVVEVPDGVLAARGAIDISGGQGMWATFDHQAVMIVQRYTLNMLGPHEASAEIDAKLDALLPSLRVAKPRATSDAGDNTLAKILVAAIAAAALYAGVRRASSSRRAARSSK